MKLDPVSGVVDMNLVGVRADGNFCLPTKRRKMMKTKISAVVKTYEIGQRSTHDKRFPPLVRSMSAPMPFSTIKNAEKNVGYCLK